MKRVALPALAACFLSLFTACIEAEAESTPPAAAPSAAIDPNQDPDKPICVYERDTGSHISTKVCRTPRQMEADRRASEDAARRNIRSNDQGGVH